MRPLLLSFLCFSSLMGCAATTEEASSSTESPVTASSLQRFRATEAELDPIIVETAVAEYTQASVLMDPAVESLRFVVVFDLFPSFYDTKITRTYVDACNAVHYEGRSDKPLGPDALVVIELIDQRASRCGDHSWRAELKTVREDGRPTHSRFVVVPA